MSHLCKGCPAQNNALMCAKHKDCLLLKEVTQ